jgi:HEXXH motif-containing protein
MEYHELTSDQLVTLANGVGGPVVMAELNASRVSLHLLLLKHLADHWPGDRHAFEAAMRVLARVQEQAPQVYADLIGDPMVGAWLTRTCSAGEPAEADFLHLGSVAAAAALRAGVDAELVVHPVAGRLALPTFGDTPTGDATGAVTVSVTGRGRVLTGAWGATLALRPLRRLRAQHENHIIDVRIEDADPYRDSYHAPAGDRLSSADAQRWQHVFEEAWRLLVSCSPDWAAEIAQGLRAVVPLVDLGDGSARSGTARDSVGAMGMSPPSSAEELAVTLVHEFHHSKLSGVIDIMPLYRPGGTERHRVAWKQDPRPTAGLIQGVYAFLGVADTWHRLSTRPELSQDARRQFVRIRAEVADGLRALEASAELTPAGDRFVAGLRSRLDALLLL